MNRPEISLPDLSIAEGEVVGFINKAKDLPTLPIVASRVVSITSETETSVKEVSDLIEKDLALSAKILQVINSPFYRFSRGITSVSEAVSLMGFKQVGNLALGLSVMGRLSEEATFGFSFRDFWQRSVAQAVAAVLTTARVRTDASHMIFTTALLQNIGTAIMVRYLPLAYGYATAVSRERQIHLVHAEREIMGTDHAELGAALAEKWNLPPSIQLPLRYHHYSELGSEMDEEVKGDALRTVVNSVNASNLLTDALYAEDSDALMDELVPRMESLVGLDRRAVEEILEELPVELSQVEDLFRTEEEQPEEVEAPAPRGEYHEVCPECGSDIGVKFCGNCGTSLLRFEETKKRVKGRKKVLVAEDSAATRTAIGNMLKRMDYEVVIALNGEEAVEMARQERPELILMDIMMPVKDGIEALKEIRSDVRMRATPVVMLTSVTDIRMVTEAIESGANDYIAKPFSVTLLIERVERYIHAR